MMYYAFESQLLYCNFCNLNNNNNNNNNYNNKKKKSKKKNLFIHLSKSSNCITEFSKLTRTPSRKYIYLWKAMINTAAKRVLVQLCYYMTREFSSTFSRIERQKSIPTESASNLLKSCAAMLVKENTI